MTDQVVLAYSGGLDTSIIIPWLQEHHRLEVHCYCGDIGQGDEELRGLEQKAKQTGEPYLIFSDHVARAQPEHHKLAGLEVKTSNLCSEITLPTGRQISRWPWLVPYEVKVFGWAFFTAFPTP